MADTKISALTALSGASVDTAADLLVIVDTSAGATKSITIDEFIIGLGLASGTSLSALADGQEIGGATTASITMRPGKGAGETLTIAGWDVDGAVLGAASILFTSNDSPTCVITSASLVTCALGTPSSGTLTSCTGLPAAGVVGTAAILGANTFTGSQTNSTAGAASAPASVWSGAPFAGTGTTSFPLVYLNMSTATASTTMSTAGTMLGINQHGTSDLIIGMTDGVIKLKVSSTGLVASNGLSATTTTAGAGEVRAANGALFGSTSQGGLYSVADGALVFTNNAVTGFTSLQLGPNAASAASPSILAPSARSGTDTDTAGGSLTIAAGKGTGTGAGGALKLQTSVPTTTGTGAGTLVTREYFAGIPKTLTESTATIVFNATVAAGKCVGGEIIVTTFASDGTDHQAITETLLWSAINKGGTVTATIQAAATTSTTAASSGTLVNTWTAVANGASVDIKCSAVSSLTQTILNCAFIVRANTNDTGMVIS